MLAAGIVVLHLAFILFAALGGVLVLRRSWVAWVHLPTAVWASYVEFSGRLCPLTPLENSLRVRAGLDDYSGDFVARYVFPLLYPEGLTRDAQFAIGAVVVTINVAIYAAVFRMRTLAGKGRSEPELGMAAVRARMGLLDDTAKRLVSVLPLFARDRFHDLVRVVIHRRAATGALHQADSSGIDSRP